MAHLITHMDVSFWKSYLNFFPQFCLVKKCDNLEQYGRRLCLSILDVDGDDFETSDEVFDECTNYLTNWSLIF